MYIWLGEGTSLNAVCTAKERIAYLKDRSIQGACVHAQLSGLGKLLKLCTLS